MCLLPVLIVCQKKDLDLLNTTGECDELAKPTAPGSAKGSAV
jgi:hypothetical protein